MLDVSVSGCFSKDQVYLDGILRILRHRRNIDFKMLTSLGKVSVDTFPTHWFSNYGMCTTRATQTFFTSCRCLMKTWRGCGRWRCPHGPESHTSCETRSGTCNIWITSSLSTSWTIQPWNICYPDCPDPNPTQAPPESKKKKKKKERRCWYTDCVMWCAEYLLSFSIIDALFGRFL